MNILTSGKFNRNTLTYVKPKHGWLGRPSRPLAIDSAGFTHENNTIKKTLLIIFAPRLKISDGEFGEWFIREESDTFLKADVEKITLVVLYFASDIFFIPYGPH